MTDLSTPRSAAASALTLVEIFPTLLGTYGDRGNPLVVANRARRRGIDVEIVRVAPGHAIPRTADLYFIGGAEDAAQGAACRLLREDGVVADLGARRAPLLAVCAGMQLLGTSFAMRDEQVTGLGLVDVASHVGDRRAVGELLTDASIGGGENEGASNRADADGGTSGFTDLLSGFENHRGLTTRGDGVAPLGVVRPGCGTGNGDGTDGFVVDRIIGTYMHGPVLARNPGLADLLLSWVVGELTPLDDSLPLALRQDRVDASTSGRRD